jgi:hypothetical protein
MGNLGQLLEGVHGADRRRRSAGGGAAGRDTTLVPCLLQKLPHFRRETSPFQRDGLARRSVRSSAVRERQAARLLRTMKQPSAWRTRPSASATQISPEAGGRVPWNFLLARVGPLHAGAKGMPPAAGSAAFAAAAPAVRDGPARRDARLPGWLPQQPGGPRDHGRRHPTPPAWPCRCNGHHGTTP